MGSLTSPLKYFSAKVDFNVSIDREEIEKKRAIARLILSATEISYV